MADTTFSWTSLSSGDKLSSKTPVAITNEIATAIDTLRQKFNLANFNTVSPSSSSGNTQTMDYLYERIEALEVFKLCTTQKNSNYGTDDSGYGFCTSNNTSVDSHCSYNHTTYDATVTSCTTAYTNYDRSRYAKTCYNYCAKYS